MGWPACLLVCWFVRVCASVLGCLLEWLLAPYPRWRAPWLGTGWREGVRRWLHGSCAFVLGRRTCLRRFAWECPAKHRVTTKGRSSGIVLRIHIDTPRCDRLVAGCLTLFFCWNARFTLFHVCLQYLCYAVFLQRPPPHPPSPSTLRRHRSPRSSPSHTRPPSQDSLARPSHQNQSQAPLERPAKRSREKKPSKDSGRDQVKEVCLF